MVKDKIIEIAHLYDQGKLNLEQLSEIVGCNLSYVSKVIKKRDLEIKQRAESITMIQKQQERISSLKDEELTIADWKYIPERRKNRWICHTNQEKQN